MSCSRCGNSYCSCGKQDYTYNWYNVDNYSCNPCSTIDVCKKKVPAKCTFYNGPALPFFNLGTNVSIEDVIVAFATAIQAIQGTHSSKTVNVQAALDNINERLNNIEGGNHPSHIL